LFILIVNDGGVMKTKVRMFGAFRKHMGDEVFIEFEQESNLSVPAIKEKISIALKEKNPQFNEDTLIADSALADESHVFQQTENIAPGGSLALLPPVCGG
jgi:molybdopterin converting factor small subunit